MIGQGRPHPLMVEKMLIWRIRLCMDFLGCREYTLKDRLRLEKTKPCGFEREHAWPI